MALDAGTRIGPYVIVAPLGSGGMGDVYRAKDTALGREVAIKVVGDEYLNDADRAARFEREARVLAALNHPNLATLYGVEHIGGGRALIMELVDGETLADRIARGPIAPLQVLAIAQQLAGGLDSAHQKGVVHRDLKPANIKLSGSGLVKILDFGIAKDMPRGDLQSRTTTMATEAGVLIGTAPYMSPEQVRGLPIDQRADIWAFGCVLYEMLTARSPFAAETRTDTLARIVQSDPVWDALPPSATPGLVRLIKRCLEKDPARRLRDIGDVELALEAPTDVRQRVPLSGRVIAGVVGAAIALTAGATMLGLFRERPAPPTPVRFEVPLSIRLIESQSSALSPDGRRLAFIGTGADGILRIWSRALDDLETRPLIGTENEVANNTTMWFSPDSRSVAFYANGAIKSVSIAGGPPEVVCKVPSVAVGGAWNADGTIVVGNAGGGLMRCSAGTEPVPVTRHHSADPSEIHLLPSFMPDGRRLIYFRAWRNNPSEAGIYAADLSLSPEQQPTERIVATNLAGRVVASTRTDGTAWLLFMRDRTLFAAALDDRLTLRGDPIEIAKDVGSFRDGAMFHGSTETLVYRAASQESQLAWVDRSGKRLDVIGEPGQYRGVALSPDGARAAALRENRLNRADGDIWIVDLRRNATTRFTTDPLMESKPAWSADGTSLMYVTGHGSGDIWLQPLSGAPRLALVLQSPAHPFRINSILTSLDSTADGRFVVFEAESLGRTRADVWSVRRTAGAAPVTVLAQEFDEGQAVVSADGRWMAYVSNESGINEVFVVAINTGADRIAVAGTPALISRGGGMAPRWRRDSRELFFQSSSGSIMAVAIADQIGEARTLFNAAGISQWDASPDGQRFLMAVPVTQGAPAPFTVVLNWQSALRR